MKINQRPNWGLLIQEHYQRHVRNQSTGTHTAGELNSVGRIGGGVR